MKITREVLEDLDNEGRNKLGLKIADWRLYISKSKYPKEGYNGETHYKKGEEYFIVERYYKDKAHLAMAGFTLEQILSMYKGYEIILTGVMRSP